MGVSVGRILTPSLNFPKVVLLRVNTTLGKAETAFNSYFQLRLLLIITHTSILEQERPPIGCFSNYHGGRLARAMPCIGLNPD